MSDAYSFAPFEAEFLDFTSRIVWCTVTTVDAKGRPRSRILHPIWEVAGGGPVGWVFTGRTPVKTRHLAANPHVSVSYWNPDHNTVTADCVASWVEEPEARRHVWDLFTTTPEPLGYDPSPFGVTGPDHPDFAALRLDPWRVQILRAEQIADGDFAPRTWRSPAEVG
ncbi:general stress protein 26 [Nocardiopsis mwathae]|uniref:General stress protein 26 n=1 Tax=Nocardiopsis mwathae TaxID=1472723 RepID=A0A7X0D7L2_9ACTN|nr:pyridoxamine 5'-phosphate oxidase family protein [Nocardiopsis mwathae]MBB6174588.1 general stress protein 26 [Nocardiopsis mwathae]